MHMLVDGHDMPNNFSVPDIDAGAQPLISGAQYVIIPPPELLDPTAMHLISPADPAHDMLYRVFVPDITSVLFQLPLPLTLPPALIGACRLAVDITSPFPDELVGVAELYQVAEATAELIPTTAPTSPILRPIIVAILIRFVLI